MNTNETTGSAQLAAWLRRDLRAASVPISWRHEVLAGDPQREFYGFCRDAVAALERPHTAEFATQTRARWLELRGRFSPAWSERLKPWNWSKVYLPALPRAAR